MLTLGSVAAFAIDTCTGTDASGGTLSVAGTITNSGVFGPFASNDQCSIGGFTFSNFEIIGGSGFPSGGAAFSASVFVNGSDQLQLSTSNLATWPGSDIEFLFQISPGVTSIVLAGTDTYTEVICGSPIGSAGSCSNPLTTPSVLTHTGGSTATYSVTVPHGGIDYVFKDISGSSELSQGVVPEPATYSMMGLGLLGLGALARRIKKS